MRILVLTSCTNVKRITDPNQLTQADFREGGVHLLQRLESLSDLFLPAKDLYTGQQHLRLMRGIRAIRSRRAVDETVPQIDLRIISAGYGVVTGDTSLAPYQCTFDGMRRGDLLEWSHTLRIPIAVRELLGTPFDLALVLLGESYLDACQLDGTLELGGPALVLSGKSGARRLPSLPQIHPLILTTDDAKRFSCGLVGLKGEIAARLLERVASDPQFLCRALGSDVDLRAELKGPLNAPVTYRRERRANLAVDHVVEIKVEWWERSRSRSLRYFIPDWDDRVDPDYDFVSETHSGGIGDWSNEVYSHQIYPSPNYDGILVSRILVMESERKRNLIEELGIHRYLRVPNQFPIMGDCGAFGYIREPVPPYTTNEILDYYSRLGFDFGVSIDHLIVAEVGDQRDFRYELTINNAAEFIDEHRRRGLEWEPVGAVQGWDPASYARAAQKYVAMGYRYIALGGLARSKTEEILNIVSAVREVVPREVDIHLFGVGRLEVAKDLAELGVRSIDSASYLRKAWLGSRYNFLSRQGWYGAIRVPEWNGIRARRIFKRREYSSAERTATEERLKELEQASLTGLRAFAAGSAPPREWLLDLLVEYDTELEGERPRIREEIRRTLEDRPWERCECVVCRRWGIEVAIFRGNNRNRRRGFHNTYLFYQLLEDVLSGNPPNWLQNRAPDRTSQQLELPLPSRA